MFDVAAVVAEIFDDMDVVMMTSKEACDWFHELPLFVNTRDENN
jgi:hypothetical protein